MAAGDGPQAQASKAEQRERKLEANRKSAPPAYFNSILLVREAIDSDTEEALILTRASTKQKAVTFLKAMTSDQSSALSDDYNDLLQEYTEARQEDADNKIAELDNITGKFNDFRTEIMDDPTEGIPAVSGFSPPISAMVRGLGRLGDIDRRVRFHQTFDKKSTLVYEKEQDTQLKEELKSWIRVFVTYP